MYKLNFKISLNCYTDLNRYATSLNLPIQTIIRHILSEQLLCYKNKPDEFKRNFINCKPKRTEGTIDAYGKQKLPKSYSIEVSEYIYTNIQEIKSEYKTKTNTVVNNILHIGIKDILKNFDIKMSTHHNDLVGITKQYAIPLSNEFTERLQDIAEIKGIKINHLMSLIIGDFLIDNYTDYDDGIYMNSETGEYNHGVW